ncbi:MAG: hypothetical protein ACOCQG_02975 [Candidatus Nanoarchaeia archaeon]
MDKKNFIWIAACFVMILVIHIFHLFIYNIGVIGKESFHSVNNALEGAGQGWYSWLLMHSGSFMQVETASFIIMLISGLASFSLFLLLLATFEQNRKIRHMALFFLLASPLFIYNVAVSQPFVIHSVLSLATIYLLMLDNVLRYLSIPVIAVTAFLEPGVFLFLILPLLFYILVKKKNSLLIGVVSFIGLVVSSLRIENIQIKDTFFSFSYFLEENIAMFGALKGFTFISCILAVVAFIYTWKKKKEYLPVYAMVLLAFIGSVYIDSSYKIILNFLFAYASAYGFWKLMHIRWELLLIKWSIFFIVIIGIVFSGVFYVNSLYSESPDEDMINALVFIRGNSLEHETVFSDTEKKEWIFYFTDRDFCCQNGAKDIFKTRDNEMAVNFMKNNTVSFILVDEKTRKLMEREGGSMGLEFVMENSNSFKKMQSFAEVGVWVFKE